MDPTKYDRSALKEKAIRILSKQNYIFKNEIGAGSYSDVLCLWSKKHHELVAAKIVHPQITSFGEAALWPTFEHPSILPVLDVIQHKSVDIFLVPYHSECLSSMSETHKNRCSSKDFETFIRWMGHVLSGLEYLHGLDVCHLDLKANNILITADGRAVICDFSAMDSSRQPTNRYTLPTYYCPPEAWPSPNSPLPKVDGVAFDVWSVGMIFFHGFTNCWMDIRLWGQTDWEAEIYPLMFKCLQEPFFDDLLHSSFPSATIRSEDRFRALNLVQGILRYIYRDRPSASQILEHSLLSKSKQKEDLLEPDTIWMVRQSIQKSGGKSHFVKGPDSTKSNALLDEDAERPIRTRLRKMVDDASASAQLRTHPRRGSPSRNASRTDERDVASSLLRERVRDCIRHSWKKVEKCSTCCS